MRSAERWRHFVEWQGMVLKARCERPHERSLRSVSNSSGQKLTLGMSRRAAPTECLRMSPHRGRPEVIGAGSNGAIDRAAKLAAIPAGASPANRRRSSHCCSYIQQREGDRAVESLVVKVPEGRESQSDPCRGQATWQAVAEANQ
jgi:hypothetical protein